MLNALDILKAVPSLKERAGERLLCLILLSMLAAEAEAQGRQLQGGAEAPRLVININIDQLRADYLEAFMPLYGEEGFRRLLTEGRIYAQAAYPFTPIDRASASATISTGTTPYYHGIPARQWLSRKTLRPTFCTKGDNAQISGAENLTVSTIGDELKVATGGSAKVFSIAESEESAIMSAGHSADAAIWMERNSGRWTTSTYYSNGQMAWLDAINRLKEPDNKNKRRPIATVNNQDITDLALQCISSAALGSDLITDLLNIEFKAGKPADTNGAPDRIVMEETYVKLDKAVGNLVTKVEQRFGRDKVLFVMTSTGYFDDNDTDYSKYRIPSGTFYINRTAGYLNMYLNAIYGQGQYVTAYLGNQIYLDHKVIEQKQIAMSDILNRSREMLLMSEGVKEVYTSLGLLSAVDADTRLVRNGYSITTSGDIIIELAPGWKLLNEDNHQQKQWRSSCVLFPIIFYGEGISHEVVTTPVTTDQIAPTICKSIRIRAPNACKSAPLH